MLHLIDYVGRGFWGVLNDTEDVIFAAPTAVEASRWLHRHHPLTPFVTSDAADVAMALEETRMFPMAFI